MKREYVYVGVVLLVLLGVLRVVGDLYMVPSWFDVASVLVVALGFLGVGVVYPTKKREG